MGSRRHRMTEDEHLDKDEATHRVSCNAICFVTTSCLASESHSVTHPQLVCRTGTGTGSSRARRDECTQGAGISDLAVGDARIMK